MNRAKLLRDSSTQIDKGWTRRKLAEMVKDRGFVATADDFQRIYGNDTQKLARWSANVLTKNHHHLPDGTRAVLFSWEIMTDCLRYGIELHQGLYELPNQFEVRIDYKSKALFEPDGEGSELYYIRNYYAVPAEIGRKVLYKGMPGVIVGTYTSHLLIKLERERIPHIYHPTYHIDYLDGKGEVQ